MFSRATTCIGLLMLLLTLGRLHAIQPNDQGNDLLEILLGAKEFKSQLSPEQIEAQLRHAGEYNDLPSEAALNKNLGITLLLGLHDYQKAMDCFIRSLTIEDSLELRQEQIITYLAIARAYEEVGDYNKSAESLEKALELNKQFDDIPTMARIFNKLGKINALMGKTEEAAGSYRQALNHKDEIQNPAIEAEALYNLARLYGEQGDFERAMHDHKEALLIRRASHDKTGEASSLNAIGDLYYKMKNEERALANHVAALEIRQTLKDKKGLAESYNNIGALYYQQKSFERAVNNVQLALEAGQESQSPEQVLKSYDLLYRCYSELGDYKKALNYNELWQSYSELIQNEKKEQQLLETQNRYDLDKKQSQIERLESIRSQREKELQEQKKFRNVLIALVVLGFIIVVLVFYLYVMKRRSNRALQDLNATKDKFFSIISHDLKGPLNSFTSFSSLLISHTDSLSKDEIRMLAKDLDKSLKNLFDLLENLLEWSRSQTGNIDFTPETFDLNSVLDQNKELLQTQAQNKKITIENKYAGKQPITAHRHSVVTVIRNLISNAIKFTPEGGKITLNAYQHQGEIIVSVADTGVGMKPDIIQKLFRIDTKHTTKGTANEKGTGLGLILCKEFIEKNGGRIWVESELGKGSTFYFTVKPGTIPALEETVSA